MRKFKKKPVIIEACRWEALGDVPEVVHDYKHFEMRIEQNAKICDYCGGDLHYHGYVQALEGTHVVCPGDMIIKGVQGEYYACKPDIFNMTYEAV